MASNNNYILNLIIQFYIINKKINIIIYSALGAKKRLNSKEMQKFFLDKNIIYYLFLFFLIIITFFLRFYKFDQVGFWGDEYLTFTLSEPMHNYNFIYERTLASGDLAPPFYYFVLNIYNFFFGHTAYSIRLFHIMFGFSNILLSFLISRLILKKRNSLLVLYFLAFNVFLIWCSTEVRIASFALFFQLLSILFFLYSLKNINSKFFLLNIFLLFLFNFFSLTTHPLSIIIIISQFFFLMLNNNYEKKIIFLLIVSLSVLFYIIFNLEYIMWSLKGTRLSHNQLNVNFFVSYNFKHYFNSYILAGIHLIIFTLTFFQIFKKTIKNNYLIYLFLIFIFTYLFIIIGTIFFTGLNGQRYWSYLVPIILIINIYYLGEVKRNLLSTLIIFFLIIYTLIVYLDKINKPPVRKPDTPGLIKIINETNINYIVSENYYHFENYLKKGYKDFNKKILSENEINSLKADFWYLCLDLSWVQTKGSYYDEIYECSPKLKNIYKHKKKNSIRLNGLIITKYKYVDIK